MLVALEDSREIAGDVAFEAAADRSKRCFAVQPVGVVARGDQQRGRGLGAKTLLVEQLGWCGELHEHRELSVELGTCHLPMRQVLQLEPGSIVQLDTTADAPVDVYVNHKLIARGEVVVVEDQLGIRVTQIVGKNSAVIEDRPGTHPTPIVRNPPVVLEDRHGATLTPIEGKLP